MNLELCAPAPDPWQQAYERVVAERPAPVPREPAVCTAEGDRVWRVTCDVASGAGVSGGAVERDEG